MLNFSFIAVTAPSTETFQGVFSVQIQLLQVNWRNRLHEIRQSFSTPEWRTRSTRNWRLTPVPRDDNATWRATGVRTYDIHGTFAVIEGCCDGSEEDFDLNRFANC
jgi:hypothetical protein